MFRRIFEKHRLEVSIISCGDTGQDIGEEMITTLKEYGAVVRSLVINAEPEKSPKNRLYDHRVLIDNTHDGFAKRIEDAIDAAERSKDQISRILPKVIPEAETGLLFVTTGAGATGLGSTLAVLELLYKNYRKIPPVITLLPDTFESSRVQYNISLFLYRTVYRSDNYGNSILLLDNKPIEDELEKPFTDVSTKRIQTIPKGFADLLFASFEKPILEEFDGTQKDLVEVIHTPGIAVFVSEDLIDDDGTTSGTNRIEDVLAGSVISATALSIDQIYQARNAFIALFNLESGDEKLSFQAEFEARKLYQKFTVTRPFVKVLAPELKGADLKPRLRAIISGIPMPNRILQIMRIARDSRKRIIAQEKDLERETIPLAIEHIMNLEDKLDY